MFQDHCSTCSTFNPIYITTEGQGPEVNSSCQVQIPVPFRVRSYLVLFRFTKSSDPVKFAVRHVQRLQSSECRPDCPDWTATGIAAGDFQSLAALHRDSLMTSVTYIIFSFWPCRAASTENPSDLLTRFAIFS